MPQRLLGGHVVQRLNRLLEEIAAENDWQVVAREVMPEQVYLFVRLRPARPSRWRATCRAADRGCLQLTPLPRLLGGAVVEVVLGRVGRVAPDGARQVSLAHLQPGGVS